MRAYHISHAEVGVKWEVNIVKARQSETFGPENLIVFVISVVSYFNLFGIYLVLIRSQQNRYNRSTLFNKIAYI